LSNSSSNLHTSCLPSVQSYFNPLIHVQFANQSSCTPVDTSSLQNKLHNYQSIISASLHIFKNHKFFPRKLLISKSSIAHQPTLRAIRLMASRSPARAKCSSHLILLDFFNLTIFGNLIHSTSLLFPLSSVITSFNILSLFSFLMAKE